MCDDETLARELSRREFASRAAATAAVALLPIGCGGTPSATTPAAPPKLTGARVDVKTPDGVADCYFVHPATGAHPGVIMWPDFMSIRPAYEALAGRLAESGYSVLVINPYYRTAKAPVVDKVDFANKELMTKIRGLAESLNHTTSVTDATALVAFLDANPAVDRARKLATFGYCMGGRLAFETAAAVPERVGALATFHAGGLVSKEPDSPHLRIPALKARVLIAIAAGDDAEDPQAKDVLRDAFSSANVPAEIDVYANTKHGWCTPDMSMYDAAQAHRAWDQMLALFRAALESPR